MAEWLTVKSAAEQLGKSERTIRRWIEKDSIPHKKTLDGIVVDVSGLEKPPPATPPIDKELSILIAENERLKDENKALREDKEYFKVALAESIKTTQQLIGAGTQSENDNDDDNDDDKAQPGHARRFKWRFWES